MNRDELIDVLTVVAGAYNRTIGETDIQVWAVGGPLFGVIGAFICMGLAFAYESKLMAALAYFGFFITLYLIWCRPIRWMEAELLYFIPDFLGCRYCVAGGIVFLLF